MIGGTFQFLGGLINVVRHATPVADGAALLPLVVIPLFKYKVPPLTSELFAKLQSIKSTAA
jgi:hypothetical protein